MGQCLKKGRSEAKATEVKVWLFDNGLEEYSEKFKEKGWDEISLLLEMTDTQIEMCIQKPGHVVKFKRALQNLDRNMDNGMEPEASNFVESNREFDELNDRNGETSYAQIKGRKRSNSDASESGKATAVRTVVYETEPRGRFKDSMLAYKSTSSSDDSLEAEVEVFSKKTVDVVTNEKIANNNLKREADEMSSISSKASDQSLEHLDNAIAHNDDREQTQMAVKWYKTKDCLYVETKAFIELKCILDEVHWATLLGKPGDGKTATAAHLMLQYMKKGYEPIFISSAQEWSNFIGMKKNEETKHFAVIDDMFGKCIVDKRKTDEWLTLMDSMFKAMKESAGSLIVICTSRSYVFADVREHLDKFKFFESYYIVDLTSETYLLAPDEKAKIFDNFAAEYRVPGRERIDVRNVDPPHGFPHCVELYCANEIFRQKGISFFDDPLECVKEEILDFKNNDVIGYIVLLLVLLNTNHMEIDYFENLKQHMNQSERNIFNEAGIDPETEKDTVYSDIYNTLDKLGHCYLTHGPDGACCFSHETLLECVAFVYMSVNPSNAIDILEFPYILAYINDGHVKLDSMKDTHRAAISRLPAGSAQALAKRITKELKQGNMTAVGFCNAWRDQSFVREWLNYVTTSADDTAGLVQAFAASSQTTSF